MTNAPDLTDAAQTETAEPDDYPTGLLASPPASSSDDSRPRLWRVRFDPPDQS